MLKKMMCRRFFTAAFTAIASFFFILPANALQPAEISGPEELRSETVAKTFYGLASQIANVEDVNRAKAKQAIVLLRAAKRLDKKATYPVPELLKLIRQYSDANQSELVQQLLREHLKKPADFEVVKNAVSYLLDRADSRESREKLGEELYRKFQTKDNHLASELLAALGLMRLEVADANGTGFLTMAYNANKYNRPAYSKLWELIPDKINAVVHLEHLRLMLGENPLDLDSAISFADYARRLELYQTAVDSFQYCADLYNYLYPNKPLPASIYLPWSISAYNSPASQSKCIELSQQVRQSGQFDLMLEAIAARAALKLADSNQADRIFNEAEKKAKEIYNSDKSNIELAKKIGWFYCFARPDANQALEWAERAYSVEPNSPMAAALFAYCLLTKKQDERAKQLAEKFQDNQIAQIVLAKLAPADAEPNKAAENLKTAIAKDSSSFEAEVAKKMLSELGQSYAALPDGEAAVSNLQSSLERPVVPAFAPPDKILSFELSLSGTRFGYTKDFGATLTIKNISAEPIIISDNGLFTGRLRVDAQISGVITKTIPNLVNLKIEPTEPIKPRKSIQVDLNLMTGQLRQILLECPQADLLIDFTVYIDPVITDGQTINRLADIKPLKCRVERTGEKITGQYLQHLYDSITKGYSGQKVNAARLFASLLAERSNLSRNKIFYKTFQAENLTQFLKSGLLKCLVDEDWEVKTQTLAAMNLVPVDQTFTKQLFENLNDTNWPVRLMAVYLLAEKDPDFRKILDSTAMHDSDELVRDMAIAFGAKVPVELQTKPTVTASKEPNSPDVNSAPMQP
jgi:hypothetical protein